MDGHQHATHQGGQSIGGLSYGAKTMLAPGPMLRSDAHAGTSGDQAEPTIASELDTFNVALNKQLQVSIDTVQAQHSIFFDLRLSMLYGTLL